MSETFRDPIGPAPETRQPRFLWLLFGACAAPLFWLGHTMLAYGVTAYICYPRDHPVALAATGPLLAAMIVFDVIALVGCAAGGWVSWHLHRRKEGSRNRFLALWGIMSSLCFFAAVLFNVIASVAVPPCAV
jgi:hypothetical protein